MAVTTLRQMRQVPDTEIEKKQKNKQIYICYSETGNIHIT